MQKVKDEVLQEPASHTATVGIVGLGYVGLPLAVEFGKVRTVIGFDISQRRIEQLKSGEDRTKEVSAEQLGSASRLCFSSEAKDLQSCGVYIVTVPTPIDSAKRPDLDPLVNASRLVGSVLTPGDLVIYESTVFPGCTEEVCVPVLEQVSGLVFNEDFFCGYSPERINPGDKVNTLTTIKKITSGSTAEAAIEVDTLYKSIIEAGTYPAASIKVAEAAKVIENTQRDINIALVNELSVIFGRLGIDTLEVLKAAGSKWNFLPFRPGLVGGHCIGVDPYYLTHKAEEVGYNPQVILAGRRINDNMSRYAAKKTVQRLVQNRIDLTDCRVGILGVTFKENCPDTRNSKVFDLIDEFQQWNIDIQIVDPWCDQVELQSLYGLEICELKDLSQVDALVVAVGHQEFRALTPEQLKSYCSQTSPVLADLKSLYDRESAEVCGFDVFRL